MLAVVVHDIVGRDEGRHIAARLTGQIGIYLPVVAFASGTVDGAVDILGTAIVGRNHEVPVAENFVEIPQITGGGVGGLDGVAALIHERVHLQSVLLTGGQHKLPESRGTHARDGVGVQTRLNDRQIAQFERHVVGFQCLFKDGHVEVACSQPEAYGAAQPGGIAVDELAHHLIVGHFHDVGQTTQATDVFLIRIFGIFVAVVAVAVGCQIHLRIIELQQ